MNLSGLFIRRPIMTTLSMISILLFGIIGYRLLPVSDLPNVDQPTISVNASLPGANPETMATSVATPLEKEFSTISGIDSMTSTCSFGSTSITLTFTLDRDIDSAAQDVQAAIARVTRRLPAGMPAPPSYRKTNPADMPIMFLGITGDNLPLSQLDRIGQTLLAPRISMIDGVAQVQVWGSAKFAVRIELDPNALVARRVGIDEVATLINQYNVNLPLGLLSGPNKVASIQANGQLVRASDFSPLIVTWRNGQPVRLQDLGDVSDSIENDQSAGWYCTKEGFQRTIGMGVFKQPGMNTVEVADRVTAVLDQLRDKMPAGASLNLLRDNSKVIRESFGDVKFTLMLTLILVVLVIFLFLRNLSATIIPSMTLPMSIVGTFTVMYLLSYSLDNLSLMALTLSVGFVVDDAIVMLENCVRHLEMGKTRRQAALDGSKEIGFTIVSMTLSLAAVFIPVLFMGGYVGRLFREFSVTIGAAVLVSGFVSLTLTPMMCSRFLRDPGHIKHGWAYRVTEAGFQAILAFYEWSLLKVLKHRLTTLAVSLAILGGSVALFIAIPKGFIPSEDRDWINVRTQGAQDTSCKAMIEHQLQLMEIIRKDPNVERFMSNVGSGPGGAGANNGSMSLLLKPRAERKLSADQIIETLRPQLNAVPGIRAMLTNPLAINIGGRGGRALYQVTFQHPDTDELYRAAEKIEMKMREMPSIQDVSSDMQLKNPQLDLVFDRDKAATLGVSPLQIESALLYAYGTSQVSTIFAPDDTYQVIMELKPEYQKDSSVLSALYIRSTTGPLIPLRAVTKQSDDVGPLQINHTGQLPSVTISFNLKPGVSLGQALEEVRNETATLRPSGMTFTLQGTAQAFQSSLSSMGILLILAIVVIYIVLGILYESFYHPITILSALPFAGFGALLTLMVFGAELSIYAFIGIIMLVGLVKKNGIIMIDFAIEAQRKEGKSPHDAIHEACMIRFRPIMMTTMAALMAGLPIALGWGAGAEARRPLGLAVVGGLLFSQTLTLYVTPVFYVVVERIRAFFHGEDKVGEEEVAVPQVVPQED